MSDSCDSGLLFLARLDEVQEDLLYYPPVLASAAVAVSVLAKSLTLKVFLCDGQGAVRRAVLSL